MTNSLNIQVKKFLNQLQINPDDLGFDSSDINLNLANHTSLSYAEYLHCNFREIAIYFYFINNEKYKTKTADDIIESWISKGLVDKDKIQLLKENVLSLEESKDSARTLLEAASFSTKIDRFIEVYNIQVDGLSDDVLENKIIAISVYIANQSGSKNRKRETVVIHYQNESKQEEINIFNSQEVFVLYFICLVACSYLIPKSSKICFEVTSAVACQEISPNPKVFRNVVDEYNRIVCEDKNHMIQSIHEQVSNLINSHNSIYLSNLQKIYESLLSRVQINS